MACRSFDSFDKYFIPALKYTGVALYWLATAKPPTVLPLQTAYKRKAQENEYGGKLKNMLSFGTGARLFVEPDHFQATLRRLYMRLASPPDSLRSTDN